MSKQKQPHKIFRVGGKEFHLYKKYDDCLKETILDYPDFEETPEYTNEGRPFSTSAQESCPNANSRDPDSHDPSDCGGCMFFHRNEQYALSGFACATR